MRSAVGVVVCLFLLAGVARAAGRDAFEGNWKVTLTPDDGGKPYDDVMMFAKAKFTTEKAKAKGFEEVSYETDTRGGQIMTFTATAKSKREGEMKWTGTGAAGELQGTMEWTKPDGSKVSYTYRGVRGETK